MNILICGDVVGRSGRRAVCDALPHLRRDLGLDFPGTPGIDGRVYVFSDASVTGDEFSGYSIRVAIDDPDHGSFVVDTTTPILFGCSNGQPSSGALQFTDGAGVLVSVTFNDCASYTVSYSGTSAMFLW